MHNVDNKDPNLVGSIVKLPEFSGPSVHSVTDALANQRITDGEEEIALIRSVDHDDDDYDDGDDELNNNDIDSSSTVSRSLNSLSPMSNDSDYCYSFSDKEEEQEVYGDRCFECNFDYCICMPPTPDCGSDGSLEVVSDSECNEEHGVSSHSESGQPPTKRRKLMRKLKSSFSE